MIEQSIFYAFATLAIFSSLMVVFAKNPVRAVLFLVLSFFAMAAIWMMLEAEFLAITLVLVYVGAVMVLFLFVVMMLDIEVGNLHILNRRHIPLGLLMLALLISVFVMAVGPHHFGEEIVSVPERAAASYNNVESLGELIYTNYVMPFEIAGVILLVAMIAAIALTFRGHRSKKQTVSEQTYVTKADRLQIVKMQGESDSL